MSALRRSGLDLISALQDSDAHQNALFEALKKGTYIPAQYSSYVTAGSATHILRGASSGSLQESVGSLAHIYLLPILF